MSELKPSEGTFFPSLGSLSSDPYILEITDLVTLHNKKKSDYANSNNQFSNFEASAKYAGVTVNQAFDVLIGTKIARLQNLKESGKDVQNESIADTEQDLSNYILIKRAYNRWLKMKEDLNYKRASAEASYIGSAIQKCPSKPESR